MREKTGGRAEYRSAIRSRRMIREAYTVPLSAYPNPTSCGERCSFKPKDTPYLNR